MKIFLDIDGVMVPFKNWQRSMLLEDGFPVFSSEAVVVLNKLIDDETEVILSTSHKSKYSMKTWKKIFKLRGVEVKNLSRLEDNTDCLNRRDEILRWFDTNGIPEKFLILDDDKSLNDLPHGFKKNLILTNAMIGLKHGLIG